MLVDQVLDAEGERAPASEVVVHSEVEQRVAVRVFLAGAGAFVDVAADSREDAQRDARLPGTNFQFTDPPNLSGLMSSTPISTFSGPRIAAQRGQALGVRVERVTFQSSEAVFAVELRSP